MLLGRVVGYEMVPDPALLDVCVLGRRSSAPVRIGRAEWGTLGRAKGKIR